MIDTSCRTWTEAAQWRRSFEAREEQARGPARRRPPGEVPTFGEVALLYLERPSKLGQLSENTIRDKRSMLRPNGPLMVAFADRPIGSITARDLEDWWARDTTPTCDTVAA